MRRGSAFQNTEDGGSLSTSQTISHQNGTKQASNSYSSIVSSVQSSHMLDAPSSRGDNPFKYSKDDLLSVWRGIVSNTDGITRLPLEFERYDSITSPMPVLPVSSTEVGEDERILLSGHINSEQKRRNENDGPARIHTGRERGERDRESRGGVGRDAHNQSQRQSLKSSRVKDVFSNNPPAPNGLDDTGSSSLHATSTFNAIPGQAVSGSDRDWHQAEGSLSSATSVGGFSDGPRDVFGTLAGRNRSRLAHLGVFELPSTSVASLPNPVLCQDDHQFQKWGDDKDDDVLREAMGFATGEQDHTDITQLADLYQNQSISFRQSAVGATNKVSEGGGQSRESSTNVGRFDPLSAGMPDLFGHGSLHQRGFMESITPSQGQYQTQTQTQNRGFIGQQTQPNVQQHITGSQAQSQFNLAHQHQLQTSTSAIPAQVQSQSRDPHVTARVMVMPDKLKWQYRDPTGAVQGPFSGLEMHDWYKAGFFQPNLLVKRMEDEDFEPLSILVRRIGNQREPFLVPLPSRVQVSQLPPGGTTSRREVPDGWSDATPPTVGTPGSSGQMAPSTNSGSSWQPQAPPFPQSFPSFGTTLTAEQQNALERRKQEEQYLMHRQREFLQQQQLSQQLATQRLLHQQQYSFGAAQGGFNPVVGRQGSPFSNSSGERQASVGSFEQSGGSQSANGVIAGWGRTNNFVPPDAGAAQSGRSGTDFGIGSFDTPKSEVASELQMGTMNFETEQPLPHVQHNDFTPSNLMELSVLGDGDIINGLPELQEGVLHRLDFDTQLGNEFSDMQRSPQQATKFAQAQFHRDQEHRHQQRQELHQEAQLGERKQTKNAALKPAQDVYQAPAPSLSNTAQSKPVIEKGQSKVLELPKHEHPTLADFTAIATDTPITPQPAPWAAAPVESTKGLSLREIQELEAKRDALRRKQERKAYAEAQAVAAQQQVLSQIQQPSALPLNWASAETTASDHGSASSGGTAWKNSSAAAKRTFAQIQQEEEHARNLRAMKLAQAQGQAQVIASALKQPTILGTRYADTVGKSSTWTTVGAGGKAPSKPIVPSVVPPELKRTATPTVKTMTKMASPSKPSTVPNQGIPNAVSVEFLNWARASLKGLNAGVNFEEFFQLLLSFGTDGGKDTQEIISDSIYANSATLDGRRFAEEFVRRRKLDLQNKDGQNKSISELTHESQSQSTGGWSDVLKAQKAAPAEDWNSAFKVVPKKGLKRRV